jgi:hypothetical protein
MTMGNVQKRSYSLLKISCSKIPTKTSEDMPVRFHRYKLRHYIVVSNQIHNLTPTVPGISSQEVFFCPADVL